MMGGQVDAWVTRPFDLEEIVSVEVKQASFVEMLQDVCKQLNHH